MANFKSTLKKVLRFITRKIVFPIYYNLNTLKPIKDDKVVFVELRLPKLSNSFKELYKCLESDYELDLRTHFIRQGFEGNARKYANMFSFLKDAATAKYIIFNEAADIFGLMRKRKNAHMLSTWHACGAFKKFGLSTRDKEFGDSGIEATLYPGHPDYDMVTVSSPEIIWAYAEAMGKENNKACIKPIGVSRTDVFFDREYINKAYDKLYSKVPLAKGKKVILYAPTFRGQTKTAYGPDELDIGLFYKNFSEDYVLLIKNHPITHKRAEIPKEYSEFAIDVTELLTIEDVICTADICISDYSSLVYEYSLFEKPMVFFAFDLEKYFDNRGFYYDYEDLAPGPICKTNEELVKAVRELTTSFDDESPYRKKIRGFRERFMSACDGHATERIVREFFGADIEKYRKNRSANT
ncbi:CDP-glycerol glycerophosphotransferase family protein [Butyrivibrio sp. WCD2001]|uniref:CDP-glycerol glycerophosphotransferase family protein n=1 Tax=Butyrivibrio sp. WCD2001 TaxID=1280681 RepID=UPI0003FB3969|nr:CDP-glycerol glycerophosphotransferase family protein [Butyrivibrio sp. WCD2001]